MPEKGVKSEIDQSLGGDEDLLVSGSHRVEGSEGEGTEPVAASPPRPPSPQGSVRGLIRTGLESIRPSLKKDEETASMKIKRKNCQLFLFLLSPHISEAT